MAVFKCKMCGGALEVNNETVATCSYCGTQQTLPKLDDEKKLALFNRANNLRIKSEFDKAAGIYESIIAEFPDDAEAFWGLVLCKYGIEYVDDKDGRKIPTCHRTLPTPIMKDEDFQQACENADINAKAIYREEAKAIDGIQKKILEIAATEEPYDIFICYKETDDATGARTEDSSIAQDIYTALTEKGYKVFYARNTLKKVAGTEYEPYIYAALSSAKIMLAIGTKFDYYDAVWVKNEWSRFISMMADDSSKILIPCYKNMDAYDIPDEFSNMQALDMNDVTFFNNLEASTKNFLKTDTKVKSNTPANINATNAENMVKRAYLLLEDKKFPEAKVFCNKALEFEPENPEAYLGSLMAENKARNIEDLGKSKKKIEKNLNYAKVMRFGDEETKNKLTEANERNKKHRKKRKTIKTSIALFMTLLLVLSIIIHTICGSGKNDKAATTTNIDAQNNVVVSGLSLKVNETSADVYNDGVLLQILKYPQGMGTPFSFEYAKEHYGFLDMNFDGEYDVYIAVADDDGIIYYYCWLYNATAKEFQYSPALSALKNISVDGAEQIILAIHFDSEGNKVISKYTFVNGSLIYLC